MNEQEAVKELKKAVRRINFKRKEKIKYNISIVIDGKSINIKSAD